jgi:methionyl-tRNA synthetase
VLHVLDTVYKKGLIIKKEYEGMYCVGCEMFKNKSDLDKDGMCADHQTKPVLMKEVNYFFPLSRYQEWLINHIKANPDWIAPEHYKNEILRMLDEPLPDLCVSRPKERCWLGIELPFDKDFVTYVWFDALLNYATVNNGEMSADCTHLMAKDILKTHSVIWPIMLRALDMNPPKHLFIHGYWTARDGTKMSKSLGNVVDPIQMLDRFGTDAIRYFLARGNSKDDSPIGEDMILGVYNAELANVIGNGFYRVLKMLDKKTGGKFPQVKSFRACDTEFISSIHARVQDFFGKDFDLQTISEQAELVLSIGREINLYLDKTAPWKLDGEEFHSCSLSCLEASRLMFELAYPIIPSSAQSVFVALNTEFNPKKYKAEIRRIKSGNIGAYQPLFQRMEGKK